LKTPKLEATTAYYTAINSLISKSHEGPSLQGRRINVAILQSNTAQAGFAFMIGKKK
jgi:hypothetical protein